MFFSALGFF